MAQPDQRLEALQKAVGHVSRETFERLTAFEARFQQWNARINLVAASTLGELWTRHIVDSAQVVRIGNGATRWVDIGSGGGFPGLVIAMMLPKGSRITLVESNRKKAGFLSAMIGEFDLPADVLAIRIEEALGRVAETDVVTARALAALPLLLDLSAPWLETGARGLFHKGRDYRAEVDESSRHWEFDLLEHASVTDPKSVVLEVSDLRRKK